MSTLLCHSVVYFQSLLALFFIIHIVIPFVCTTTAFMITSMVSAKESDEVALRAFKSNIIHDPQGVLNSWNDSQHFCEWRGVTCGHRHKRVTRLNLGARGLSGNLSPFIGNLSFLRELHLHNNSFQGEIPREFGRLFRLRVLNMENNTLVGQIPTNLSYCSKLTFLALGRNKLSGKLSPEFGSLYNLQILIIHRNNFTGVIPPFLGNLTSLKIISAGRNAFEGTIPESLGQLKQLSSVGLGENNLDGTIPLSLYNLSFLTNFSLSRNQLHGSLPPNFGLTLPNLKLFQLSSNLLSGSIPLSLSNASKLQHFDVVRNNFSGKLSIDFGGMQHLERLKLGHNYLGSGEVDEMNFINSLANCSKLWSLTLGINQFKGTLPPSIANLSTKLQRLQFSRNLLYGTIPSGVGNLVNLYLLSLSENQFTGPIPKEIAQIRNLQSLDLQDNHFLGEIPFVLGNVSLLYELHLSNNKLSGVIPSSLGNLKQLSILNLFQNDLIGTIPEEIFNITHLSISLYLAQNHLIGSISPKIGDLKALLRFDVSDNNLNGQIPNEVAFCIGLEYLRMENNFFSGSLPPSLSILKGIREIDLSHNNLSGQIPKSLETLLMLENLNLSFNNLEGEVPVKGIFTNASAISVAGNSNKLCGGITQLQLPKCLDNNSKKETTLPVFKILISVVGSFLGLIMLSIFIFGWLKSRRANQAFGIGPTLRKAPMRVSYERLLKATNNFSRAYLIGEGSFSSVYKGIIDGSGTIVAIKVIKLQHQGAAKSFMAECKAMRNIRHRNLVRVITSCSSIDFQGNDFKAIVYEFMPNESLEKWLHPILESEDKQLEIRSLTLLQRINIAIDVASALDYLHHHCQEPIFHCDLKPSNVLLDGDMTAHVGDFGLARFFPEISNVTESSSIGVKGTIGYTAPEYGLGSNASTNGDVYSYGILLLEMVTRKRPTDLMFGGDFNLHNFAKTALPDQVMDIVDPMLINEAVNTSAHKMIQAINNKKECLISMVRVGVACSMESPQNRMNISHVIHELQLVKNSLLEPTSGFKIPRV